LVEQSEQAAAKRRKDRRSSGKLSENAQQSNVDDGDVDAAKGSSSLSDISVDEAVVIDRRNAVSGPGAYSKTPAARKRRGKGEDAPIDLSEDSSDLSTVFDGDDNDSVIDATPLTPRAPAKTFDKDLPFPIYWTEVASAITKDVIPVDLSSHASNRNE
jgi:xeroderma pigmentosum group C-complementing protein